MSHERNGRIYGLHTLIGKDETFFGKSPLKKALDMAWSDGCPVAISLTNPVEIGGRGAEVMVKRYGQVNFWAGMIFEVLHKSDAHELINQLVVVKKRNPNEPLGIHDADWTPKELKKYMLVSPELYSLPRIVIAHIKGETLEERLDRSEEVLNILEETSKSTKNIKEFMVKVVDSLVKKGGNSTLLLKNMLPQGKIGEDNCFEDYAETIKIMKYIAPELHNKYMDISDLEKAKTGMFVASI